MPWLKWYPSRAQESFRWASLTLEERGFFHELYDIAAISEPRGILANTVGPISDEQLAERLSVPEDKFGALLARLLSAKLIERNGEKALVFPDFARHQRNGPYRVRGARVAQPGRGNGAADVEVDVDKEKEEEKKAPLPKVLDTPEFKIAWTNWLQYRKQSRYKRYVPLGLKRLWNKLARWAGEFGVPAVVEAINLSIENGWQGLFEPRPDALRREQQAHDPMNDIPTAEELRAHEAELDAERSGSDRPAS